MGVTKMTKRIKTKEEKKIKALIFYIPDSRDMWDIAKHESERRGYKGFVHINEFVSELLEGDSIFQVRPEYEDIVRTAYIQTKIKDERIFVFYD